MLRVIIFNLFLFSVGLSYGATNVVPIQSLLVDNSLSGDKIVTSGFLSESSGEYVIYPYEIDADNMDFTRGITVIAERGSLTNCLGSYVLISGEYYAQSKRRRRQLIPGKSIRFLKRKESEATRSSCSTN